MNKTNDDHHGARHRPPPGRTNLASCVVAAIFLVFVVILLLIVFFTLLHPKPPSVLVSSVQLPAFFASPATSAVNFTFSQYLSVRNPNRDAFLHYRSTLQLFYAGSSVGFMFIPAGSVPGRRTVYMSATFPVSSFSFAAGGGGSGVGTEAASGGRGAAGYESMEVESRLTIEGRVRILHFFTHRVEAKASCLVEISVRDGSVLSFHCQ